MGSDVEEIVQWDRELLQTKTYTTAFTILVSNCKYDGPKLEEQQKLLLWFINCPADEYFKRRSNHLRYQMRRMHVDVQWRKQMVEMGNLSQLTPRLTVIAMNRPALGTRMTDTYLMKVNAGDIVILFVSISRQT